jgi:signal transduction histidine kinase
MISSENGMLTGAQVNLILVFFIYGLAFFSMGLVLVLEAGRSPFLAEARVLLPLALFGFAHGLHEWLEMVLQMGDWLGFQSPALLAWGRLVILVLSFSSLIAFGLLSLRPQRRFSRADAYAGFGFFSLYFILVALVYLNHPYNPSNWMRVADVLARYFLAVPGAVLAALALSRQASRAQAQQRLRLARSFRWAAVGFAVYSITQFFVPVWDIFPANFINATAFYNLFGFPIQALRAGVAIVITVSIIRAIQVVEEERQKEFVAVQQARLDALEQVRHDLLEREAMRHELLRHTVIAQEEERARIARELHDETAQILTGFSLNLATLRELLPSDPRISGILTRLQGLSRRMSQGVYRMMHDLRPAQLDDLGLVAALNYLVEELHKSSELEVVVNVTGERQRLEPLVETVLFRVAQEALTNVARHAEVSQAVVQLTFTPEQVIQQVRDEGVGFDVNEHQSPPHGWGLAGMRERAESIGAQFGIVSSIGRGTQIEVIVPFKAVMDAPFRAAGGSTVVEKVG